MEALMMVWESGFAFVGLVSVSFGWMLVKG